MAVSGLSPTVSTYGAVVQAYLQSKEYNNAMQVYTAARPRNTLRTMCSSLGVMELCS
jgi:hypothetical protein